MILKGSQRSGAGQLAAHLMNRDDNDHVELLELRGFMANDLHGALGEAHAVSKGTRCKQFMFSLSLSPPKEGEASLEAMTAAVDAAEERLGLKGQPRALVVHEKNGRRHMHAVWSRIDVDEMKAINLPHFKNRLCGLSKELYLQHGWELPEGHRENGWKNPLNFTLAEWQQCKRVGLDPKELKQLFGDAWQRSDNLSSFRHALEERGYFLAAGGRRPFVAVDVSGEVFSLTRMTGAKTKDLSARLGDPSKLPSVDDVRASLKSRVRGEVKARLDTLKKDQTEARRPFVDARNKFVERHRAERERLNMLQGERRVQENQSRAQRIKRGILGVWEILTGKAAIIRRENDQETLAGYRRDLEQRERLEQLRALEAGMRIDAMIVDTVPLGVEERGRVFASVAKVLVLTGVSSTRPRERQQSPTYGMT